MNTIALSLRFDLAAIFVCAGAVKRVRPTDFETALRKYRVVPERLVHATAGAVAVVELILGLALAVGLFLRAVSILLALLLVIFSAVVAVNLARGRSFDCGCGISLVNRTISWSLVAQDLALAAVAMVVAAQAPTTLALDRFRLGEPAVGIASWAPALILSLLLLLLAALVRESFAMRTLTR